MFTNVPRGHKFGFFSDFSRPFYSLVFLLFPSLTFSPVFFFIYAFILTRYSHFSTFLRARVGITKGCHGGPQAISGEFY